MRFHLSMRPLPGSRIILNAKVCCVLCKLHIGKSAEGTAIRGKFSIFALARLDGIEKLK